jgi:hypothetical protein
MEDAHTVLIDVPDIQETAFCAVFDGHGGKHLLFFVPVIRMACCRPDDSEVLCDLSSWKYIK